MLTIVEGQPHDANERLRGISARFWESATFSVANNRTIRPCAILDCMTRRLVHWVGRRRGSCVALQPAGRRSCRIGGSRVLDEDFFWVASGLRWGEGEVLLRSERNALFEDAEPVGAGD